MGYHYVPKFYLAGFTEPNDPDTIWRYQLRSPDVLRTSLKNVAQETGFYSDETEAFLSDTIENPANRVIKKIRAQETIDRADRKALTDYIVVFLKRVPKGKARSKKIYDSIKQPTLDELTNEVTTLMRQHPDKKTLLEGRLQEIQRIILEDSIKPEKLWELNLPPSQSPGVVEEISQMTWRFLLASENDYFLTSDNPVFYFESIGIANPKSELVFPISSKVALWATWISQSKEGFVKTRRQVVHEINRRLVKSATKYVFHSTFNRKVVELVNKPLRLNLIT